MSKKETDQDSLDEQELETIFSLAKPREKPPEFLEQKVRRAVYAEWRKATSPASQRSRPAYFAAAALVLAVAAAALLSQTGRGVVAYESVQVARLGGTATLTRAGENSAVTVDETIRLLSGDELRTAKDGGVSLQLSGSKQLRLNNSTQVHFGRDGKLRLAAGRIYIHSAESPQDSRGANKGQQPAITVETSLGRVQHIGTRFQVAISPAILRVDVRDGKVAVTSEAGSDILAAAGQSVSLVRTGDAEVTQSGAYGEQWQWVDALAPPLAIEGRSLHDVLEWAAHESGREVVFSDAALEKETFSTTLHGPLILEEPLAGLRKVLLTTRMQFELRDNQIYVFQTSPGL